MNQKRPCYSCISLQWWTEFRLERSQESRRTRYLLFRSVSSCWTKANICAQQPTEGVCQQHNPSAHKPPCFCKWSHLSLLLSLGEIHLFIPPLVDTWPSLKLALFSSANPSSPAFPTFSFSSAFTSGPDARAPHSLMHTHLLQHKPSTAAPAFTVPCPPHLHEVLSRALSPKAMGNCTEKWHGLAAPPSTHNEKQCRNWWSLKDFLKINSLCQGLTGGGSGYFFSMLSNRDGEKCEWSSKGTAQK